MNQIYQALLELVQDRVEIDAVATGDSRLIEDLGLDSLARTELWAALEHEFRCKIPRPEVEKFRTVQDVMNYLDRSGITGA